MHLQTTLLAVCAATTLLLQIATFIRHIKETHKEFYRLPQELFQTSKIAKYLIMLEKVINKEDQGKILDEFNMQLAALEPEETPKRGTVEKDEKGFFANAGGGE